MRGAPALVFCLSVATLAAEPRVPSFKLTVRPGGATGNGFLVKEFRPGPHSGLLLVTALHVVHGASEVDVRRPDCKVTRAVDDHVDLLGDNQGVTIWPEYDLAAFEVGQKYLRRDEEAGTLDFDATLPGAGAELWVRATGKESVCLEGQASVVETPTVYAQMRHIAQVGGSTEVEKEIPKLAGGYSLDAFLIQYLGTASPGSSGAPVVLKSTPLRVIGVHVAGYERSANSWAMALSGHRGDLLAKARQVQLGSWSSGYQKPLLAQSLESFQRAFEPSVVSLQALFAADFAPWSKVGRPSFSVVGRVQGEVAVFPSGSHESSLSLDGELGYRSSRPSQLFLSPTSLAMTSGPQIAQEGLLAGFGLTFRFLRYFVVRPEARVGMRLWFAAWHPPGEIASPDLTLGFPFRVGVGIGQLELPGSWGARLDFGVHLEGAIEQAPNTVFTYQGDGAKFSQAPREWLTRLGGVVGVALWL